MAFGKRGLLFLLLAGGAMPVQLRGAELVGLVREADTGEMIVGASVRAIPLSKNLQEVLSRTNSNGRYHLELLRGKYRLFLSFPDSDYLPQFSFDRRTPQGETIDVPTFDSFRIINLTMTLGAPSPRKWLVSVTIRHFLIFVLRPLLKSSGLQITTRSDGSYH